MPATRVLIVDDSVVVRRMLAKLLDAAPNIEVVGTARNGRVGLERLDQLSPDIMILDLEMPEMSGLEMLEQLTDAGRHLPIILLSALTRRGAAITLDALLLGAADYVTKPTTQGGAPDLDRVRDELVEKIEALRPRGTPVPAKQKPAPIPVVPRPTQRPAPTRIDAIVVASSTGGPVALQRVLSKLSKNSGVPILIVQHIPTLFSAQLAHSLSRRTPLDVREGAHGLRVSDAAAFIAPGGLHMLVGRDHDGSVRIALSEAETVNSCRPSADVLFASAAETWGPHLLAVVLTGMGADGLEGSRAVDRAGGIVVAQDERSSVVWGMPGSVARAGLADRVLPIEQVGPAINAYLRAAPGARQASP